MLSIIIPTLNEAKYLKKTLRALQKNATHECVKEIIVVDGGSSDKTGIIAMEGGARIIYETAAPKGRAFLLNRGAEFASGTAILFLDADSIVPKGYDEDILHCLASDGNVGGAFEFTLVGKQFGLRVVEAVNRLRYRLFPWYYGDQGLFVIKEVFDQAGGFPQVKIMESSDLSRRLWKYGRLCLIKKPMLTSARRFLKYGIYRVLGQDFELWLLNILGRDVEQYADEYWRFNKNKKR